MTGFAVVKAQIGGETVELVVRSLNSRFLDLRVSLPHPFSEIEPLIRQKVSEVIKRGRVEIYLRWEKKDVPEKVVDIEKLKKIKKSLDEAFKAINYPECPVNVLFEFKELLLPHEKITPSPEIVEFVTEKLILQALKKLDTVRRKEGKAMARALRKLLDALNRYMKDIIKESKNHIKKARNEFKRAVEEISILKDESLQKKIAGDIAIVLTRRDVNEEIERLKAHIQAFKRTMKSDGPVGRELDFLAQEMHREANTIASKSFTAELSHLSVKVRTTVEKMREILANVE